MGTHLPVSRAPLSLPPEWVSTSSVAVQRTSSKPGPYGRLFEPRLPRSAHSRGVIPNPGFDANGNPAFHPIILQKNPLLSEDSVRATSIAEGELNAPIASNV